MIFLDGLIVYFLNKMIIEKYIFKLIILSCIFLLTLARMILDDTYIGLVNKRLNGKRIISKAPIYKEIEDENGKEQMVRRLINTISIWTVIIIFILFLVEGAI